jgi:hypothetical protein
MKSLSGRAGVIFGYAEVWAEDWMFYGFWAKYF